MSETFATALEFRSRTFVVRHRGPLKAFIGKDRGLHMLGILIPVSGRVQEAAAIDFPAQQFDEVGLHYAPLMMPLFRPRIRKKQVGCAQRQIRNLRAQHFYGVVANDANIGQLVALDREQAMADAGLVDFDANVVFVWILRSHRDQEFAVAKADLHH